MIKAVCVNDSNRPDAIPISKWVKKGEIYTIIHVSVHTLQQGLQGVQLSEIHLDESCFPYEAFKLSRFAINVKDIPNLIELIKNCSELNDVDIQKLLTQEEMTLLEVE
jgi:hypothetical protein